jgi:hypothetical protein
MALRPWIAQLPSVSVEHGTTIGRSDESVSIALLKKDEE